MSDNKKIEQSGANAVGHSNVFTAVTTAIIDNFSKKGLLPGIADDVRADGKTCLITGANSGLGKAVAILMAKRGAHVIMACRSGIPEAGEEVKKLSASNKVEMMHVDLADTNSIHHLCDVIKDRGIKLDITIFNAGLMPLNARQSAQGYEVMFAVHFLGNSLMSQRLLDDGSIIKAANKPARIIFVSSEAHQSSEAIDFDNFDAYHDYGIKDGLKYYGLSKLYLTTYAKELSRRSNSNELAPELAVHALCPGPVASNISREAPAWLKPILNPIFKVFFSSPEKAAEPILYLALSDDGGQRSGIYLHMMREKQPSALACDEENGQKLWQHSSQMLAKHSAENVTA